MPRFKVLTAEQHSYDDPAEDLLYELLSDIERGDEQFFIIERLADMSHQTFAQVTRDEAGTWFVERREGRAEEHYSVALGSLHDAHKVLTDWMSGATSAPVNWQRLEL